ncbi:hypothetical protein L7F22_002593 [Adiantum nelumboides]|nr:hypothetical protein [Adiantum nelumboides]
MVVLAASVVSKHGKVLVSRQFANISGVRIEGLLAAFPKLIVGEKQHTYVEAENVRYVYQPLESLYILLVTNKQSNILEDLETLRLFSKIIPEFCPSLEEEAISSLAFELIFAIDELISMGHKESVTIAQVKQYLEMESHEEKLHKLVVQSKIDEAKDVMMRKASAIDKNKLEKLRSDSMSFVPASANGSGRYSNGFQDSKSFGNGSSDGGLRFGSLDSIAPPKPAARGSTPLSTPSNGGMKLGKGQGTKQLLESLKAEGEVILDEVQSLPGPLRTVAISTEPVSVSIEEKLIVTLKKDGGLENFELQGTMTLIVQDNEHGQIFVQVESGADDKVQLKTHPRIDKDRFLKEKVLGLKNASASFPVGTPLEVLKWRLQSRDESLVPLNINCWPSVSRNECLVNIEYEASRAFELKNVIVSIPLPALRESPTVNQVDGDWRYDSRKSILEWNILLIDNSNRSGSMEFVVPTSDPSAFFPIDVKFSASKFFCNVKLAGVCDAHNGNNTRYSSETQLVVDSYQVV